VNEQDQLVQWIIAAKEQGFVAVDTETDGLDPMAAHLVGVAGPGRARRADIPLAHGANKIDLLSEERPKQIEMGVAIELLKPLLEDPSVLKIGQNIKYDISIFRGHGIDVRRLMTRCRCRSCWKRDSTITAWTSCRSCISAIRRCRSRS